MIKSHFGDNWGEFEYRLMAGFSSETTEARRQWNAHIKVLKEKKKPVNVKFCVQLRYSSNTGVK